MEAVGAILDTQLKRFDLCAIMIYYLVTTKKCTYFNLLNKYICLMKVYYLLF